MKLSTDLRLTRTFEDSTRILASCFLLELGVLSTDLTFSLVVLDNDGTVQVQQQHGNDDCEADVAVKRLLWVGGAGVSVQLLHLGQS